MQTLADELCVLSGSACMCGLRASSQSLGHTSTSILANKKGSDGSRRSENKQQAVAHCGHI